MPDFGGSGAERIQRRAQTRHRHPRTAIVTHRRCRNDNHEDKNLGIKGKPETVKFYLHLNNRPVEIYKNSQMRSIVITSKDTVYWESE